MSETTQRTPEEIEAEVAKARAQALLAEAEARKAQAEADQAELTFERNARANRAELASDEHSHIYQFTGAVDAGSVAKAIAKLSEWHRLSPDCDIEIRFYSPGGSVLAGFNLFDHLVWLRNNGHKVTTVATGIAASMAGILLQAGTVRVIGKQSVLHIHEISSLASGKIGEIEDEMAFIKARRKSSNCTLSVPRSVRPGSRPCTAARRRTFPRLRPSSTVSWTRSAKRRRTAAVTRDPIDVPGQALGV